MVPIEVRVFCKTYVKALNIALLFLMVSPAAKKLGLVKVDRILERATPSIEFSVSAIIVVVSGDKFATYLQPL